MFRSLGINCFVFNRMVCRGCLLAIWALCAVLQAAPVAVDKGGQAFTPRPVAEQKADLRELIAQGISTGQSVITLPPGRYRVAPIKREHLVFKGLKNITINAEGVEMICTQTTRAINIEQCENFTLRGLVIDYDPLPFTQARITAISADQKEVSVAVIAGYPEPKAGRGSVEVFDPASNELRGRFSFHDIPCAPTGPGRATLTQPNPARGVPFGLVGDIVVIRSSLGSGGEISHAITLADSVGTTLDAVSLCASNCFGFYENGCTQTKYVKCRIGRRAPATDLVARGYPRLRSTNADGFHSKNARQGPLYDRCTVLYNGDDSIAINGDFHYVSSGDRATLRVLAKNQMTMRKGDGVQLFSYDGSRIDNRKITAIEEDGEITPKERASLVDQKNIDERLRTQGMAKAYRVTLDAPVSVVPGTLICSAETIGSGFIVRDCQLGHNRSRGIIVKACRGQITGNQIEGCVMTGILISPEFHWLEGGLSDDLLIAKNRIINGRGMGIAVAAGGDHQLAPAGAFRNITIRDNVIQGGAEPGLLTTSIRGLVEEGNSVQTNPKYSLFSWERGGWAKVDLEPRLSLNVE